MLMGNMARILVVEDDEGTREVLADYLHECGFTVTTASDGYQALSLLQEAPPYDLILLDMVMPRSDGRAVLDAMREARETCPVVMMTSWGGLQSRIDARQLGCAELIRKPFSTEVLDATLSRVLVGSCGHAR